MIAAELLRQLSGILGHQADDLVAILVGLHDRERQVAAFLDQRATDRRNRFDESAYLVESCLGIDPVTQRRLDEKADTLGIGPVVFGQREVAIIGERQRLDHPIADRQLHAPLSRKLDCPAQHRIHFGVPDRRIARVARNIDFLQGKIGTTAQADQRDPLVIAVGLPARSRHNDFALPDVLRVCIVLREGREWEHSERGHKDNKAAHDFSPVFPAGSTPRAPESSIRRGRLTARRLRLTRK